LRRDDGEAPSLRTAGPGKLMRAVNRRSPGHHQVGT
jgi:hypothetical protein